MTKEELYGAIGEIRDDYIQQAHMGNKRILLTWIAVAACLVIAVSFALPKPEIPPVEETEATGWGTSYLYSIPEGEFSSYFAGKVIDEAQIGSKLCEVIVEAGWWSHGEEGWTSRETLIAEVYEIHGFQKETAIALKFLEEGEALTTTHYYVQMNPASDLTGLEDYIIQEWSPNDPGDE